MSSPPRRSPLIIYASAGGVAFVIALIMYFGFVVTMQRRAELARTTAERLTKQLEKAQAYVQTHKNPAEQKKIIEQMTTRTEAAVSHGPVDVDVGNYFEERAKAFNIDDLRWSVTGGIKPPTQGKDEAPRMMTDPTALKPSTIEIQFTARYRDVLSFVKALSPEEGAAKWPIEILKVEMKRAASGASKNYKVAVDLSVRYLYQ
jgi:hypothetical protein